MSDNGTIDLPPLEELVKGRLRKQVEDLGSVKKLSEKLKMPYTSVSRAVAGKCTIVAENAQTFLNKVAVDHDELKMLMLHYYPKEAKFWMSVFAKGRHSGDLKEMNDYIEKGHQFFFIYSLAGIGEGLPLEAVQKNWGREGLKNASILAAAGHVDLNGEVLTRQNKDIYYSEPSTVLKVIEHLTVNFDYDNLKNGTGGMFHILEGLNLEGAKEMRKIMVNTSVEVMKIVADKKYQGEHAVHFSLLTGIAPFQK